MENFTPWASLFGGILIGLSAALLFIGQGRIAGIMGIFNGLFAPIKKDEVWRFFFIGGLVLGGVGVIHFLPNSTAINFTLPYPLLIIGGLFVGLGTRMGNGCTSGHGICGLGRRSPRSLAAVMSFMISGMIMVLILRLLGVLA